MALGPRAARLDPPPGGREKTCAHPFNGAPAAMMSRTDTREARETTTARPQASARTERRPWPRPDFVETSACAEIGAYAFQAK